MFTNTGYNGYVLASISAAKKKKSLALKAETTDSLLFIIYNESQILDISQECD